MAFLIFGRVVMALALEPYFVFLNLGSSGLPHRF
jgi:hypothetical protein